MQSPANNENPLGTPFSYSSIETFDIMHYFTGVTKLAGYDFRECKSLKSIIISSQVSAVSYGCCWSCSQLASVVIQEGVKDIYSYAFISCGLIERIVIPSTIIRIANSAFQGCSKLKTYIALPLVPPTLGNTNITTGSSIYVPDESVEAYKTADVWSTYASRIYPLSEYEGEPSWNQ